MSNRGRATTLSARRRQWVDLLGELNASNAHQPGISHTISAGLTRPQFPPKERHTADGQEDRRRRRRGCRCTPAGVQYNHPSFRADRSCRKRKLFRRRRGSPCRRPDWPRRLPRHRRHRRHRRSCQQIRNRPRLPYLPFRLNRQSRPLPCHRCQFPSCRRCRRQFRCCCRHRPFRPPPPPVPVFTVPVPSFEQASPRTAHADRKKISDSLFMRSPRPIR